MDRTFCPDSSGSQKKNSRSRGSRKAPKHYKAPQRNTTVGLNNSLCSSTFHLLFKRETTLLFITKAPRRGQEPNSVAVETTKERREGIISCQHQLRGNTYNSGQITPQAATDLRRRHHRRQRVWHLASILPTHTDVHHYPGPYNIITHHYLTLNNYFAGLLHHIIICLLRRQRVKLLPRHLHPHTQSKRLSQQSTINLVTYLAYTT